jgi:hypothetical protein
MAKLVIDIQSAGEPEENDVIAFSGGCWKAVPRESFLARYIDLQRKENQGFREDISKLQRDLVSLAKIVKEK